MASNDSAAVHTPLKRTLGRYQVLLYGLGSMLGAGIYSLMGELAGVAGSALWAAFGVAMIGALLTGLSYASLGSRHPRAAGAAYITQHAFHKPMLSYVIGFAVLMSGLTSMATGSRAIANNLIRAFSDSPPAAVSTGSTAQSTQADPAPAAVPTLTTQPGEVPAATQKAELSQAAAIVPTDNAPWYTPGKLFATNKLVAAGAVLLIGLVLVKGIRECMWLNITCTVVESIGLLFIIVVGVRFWGSVSYLELPTPPAGATNWAAPAVTLLMLNGAVLAFFSFIGFEDILNVSEEVKNPRTDVPFGLIGAMILATLIYIAVAITAVSVVPHATLAQSKTPLMDVAHTAAPWFKGIDTIYIIVTIFAVGNTALLNYLMGSRLLYGMSRQGLLPGILGRVNKRTQTPVIAIGVLFLIVVVLIGVGNIGQLASATVLLLLSVFVFMNASLIRLKLRPNEPRGGFEIPIIIPILGMIVCGGLIGVKVISPFFGTGQSTLLEALTAPIIAGAILLIGAALYFVLRPKNVVAEATDSIER
jgi:amino acid transporter